MKNEMETKRHNGNKWSAQMLKCRQLVNNSANFETLSLTKSTKVEGEKEGKKKQFFICASASSLRESLGTGESLPAVKIA